MYLLLFLFLRFCLKWDRGWVVATLKWKNGIHWAKQESLETWAFPLQFFECKMCRKLSSSLIPKENYLPPKLIFLGVILFFHDWQQQKEKKNIISDRCAQLDENISYFISEISRNNSGCHWCRKHRVRQTRIFFRCFISRTRVVNQYEPKTCTFCYQLTRDQTKSASEIR